MKLEDQVAPLALAMRMKDLGFPQEALFVWDESGQVARMDIEMLLLVALPESKTGYTHGWRPPRPMCAAPTVAEMGEWLPENSHTARLSDGRWSSCSKKQRRDADHHGSETEAASRARILIAAVKLGHLDPKSLEMQPHR